MITYFTVSFRKCNCCSYKGEAYTFTQKTNITSEAPGWACMTTSIHCPVCNAEDLSTGFTDPDCTIAEKEPEVCIIDQPKSTTHE